MAVETKAEAAGSQAGQSLALMRQRANRKGYRCELTQQRLSEATLVRALEAILCEASVEVGAEEVSYSHGSQRRSYRFGVKPWGPREVHGWVVEEPNPLGGRQALHVRPSEVVALVDHYARAEEKARFVELVRAAHASWPKTRRGAARGAAQWVADHGLALRRGFVPALPLRRAIAETVLRGEMTLSGLAEAAGLINSSARPDSSWLSRTVGLQSTQVSAGSGAERFREVLDTRDQRMREAYGALARLCGRWPAEVGL